MSKVLTFSRTYPSYHPKKGQPTYFVEKILNSITPKTKSGATDLDLVDKIILPIVNDFFLLFPEEHIKHHTIRAGHRFKVGDKFSPRVWSGKPYQSKQIIIAPDIEVKKVWNFELLDFDGVYCCRINSEPYGQLHGLNATNDIAKNDGLIMQDFIDWFTLSPSFKKNKSFSGQIICWNENIEY